MNGSILAARRGPANALLTRPRTRVWTGGSLDRSGYTPLRSLPRIASSSGEGSWIGARTCAELKRTGSLTTAATSS
ncbi:hypothetical protein [Sorangium sp. So ce1097]|uniref:hypothetical protein n=1 Tax=Sorangium sp. So ce1097 TaxID=3133330 RepID=UPI003F63EA2C